jgi:hypothetical protein
MVVLFIRKDISTPFKWLADISFIRWAFEAAVIAVYSNSKEIRCNNQQALTELCTGPMILDYFDFGDSFGVCIAVLIGILIVLRLAAYVVLHLLAWMTSSDG